MRFLRFRRQLREVLDGHAVGAVGYEDVRHHRGVDAAHVYGGIVAHLMSLCEERDVPYQGINVATVKRLATGKGNAKKDLMGEAAGRRWPDHDFSDDNEVDARWIAEALADDLGVPA